MSLGSKIRALRKERGWTAEYLAEISGCTQSTISEIENDKRSPQYDTLEKIAKAFKLPLIDILPLEAHTGKANFTEEEKQLLSIFHQLKPEQRKQLVEFVLSFLDKEKQKRSQ
jgi:transcriptional regulator with XRE-family HTH domain